MAKAKEMIMELDAQNLANASQGSATPIHRFEAVLDSIREAALTCLSSFNAQNSANLV